MVIGALVGVMLIGIGDSLLSVTQPGKCTRSDVQIEYRYDGTYWRWVTRIRCVQWETVRPNAGLGYAVLVAGGLLTVIAGAMVYSEIREGPRSRPLRPP